MTLFDVEELCLYWSRHPPIHVMLAAFLGVKSEEPAVMPQMPAAESTQPQQSMPYSIALAGIPGVTAGTAESDGFTPIFDVAELMRQRPD